jgi:CheY-like chemotaxis protein
MQRITNTISSPQNGLGKNKIKNPLYIVNDGEECMDFLCHRGKYSDKAAAPRPFLLLLDLNMPKLDGLGVLQKIKKEKSLKKLHVVVQTTSNLDRDRIESYNLGVNSFITKPVEFSKFEDAIKAINQFWEIVEPANGNFS